MGDRKYFFFDIDNTIAIGFPRVVPESTKRTLKELQDKGHYVSIATGRMHIMAREFCEELGIHNMVTDGGNGLVIDGKVYIEPLDRDMVVSIVDEFEEKNIPWSVCLDDTRMWYTKNSVFPDAMSKVLKIKGYMETTIVENMNIRDYDKIYKGFAYLTRSEEEKVDGLKNVTYTRYSDHYIIIEPDDKSRGIKKLMEIMNLEDEDIVVFGDNTNDIKMFRPEWTSIAMGNAVDSLKEIADFVTRDADDGGIEFACRHFGWID